ncbi:Short-chain dehydrogenase/reductase superfamily [Cavenderia fasciculata]|uniref:Short-chain dehydrogenase/reductase superfamily n=1 Tax=Cavenderia fasciculata TaxID=261658 RepID=F4Q798_CACFS|nr:Short-chain dehydrogenase/reductase superfamily [Cavenderia fasciculata]EGG16280.1 Short-chain dehydrogenase/reductase superfamily [Cavenderia fasciculata]|eukprot:XP_004354664.1 Short-chain dehydrogenase/reductase superfamily [Cavenderia fasciculata]
MTCLIKSNTTLLKRIASRATTSVFGQYQSNYSTSTNNVYYKQQEPISLVGKNALVTGGSRGIGYGIAHELAERGCNVTILSRDETRGKEALGSLPLTHQNQRHGNLVADLSSSNAPKQIDSLLASLKSTTTTDDQQDSSSSSSSSSFDIIVHAAGIAQSSLFMRTNPEETTSIINTNLVSPIYLTRQLIKPMVQSKWGRIIFIGSVVGSMGNKGQTIYGASKMGVVGFSTSLSKEVGSFGITSNVVSPGYTETDMTASIIQSPLASKILEKIPIGRFGHVNDISKTVMFIIESDYLTGQNIHVNGGLFTSP